MLQVSKSRIARGDLRNCFPSSPLWRTCRGNNCCAVEHNGWVDPPLTTFSSGCFGHYVYRPVIECKYIIDDVKR